jgi:phospholipid-binding lipoprotein MlaA
MAIFARLVTAMLVTVLGGCATAAKNPADPLESLNRAMFSFNETVDDAVLKPVAKGYRAVVPQLVRRGVTNFFANLEDPWISANNLMQGKVELGLGDFIRFAVNSTLGLFGVLDVASEMGIEKHNEDFGQTLGRWGVGSGPYLVLPFLGPSTLRDGPAVIADYTASPLTFFVEDVAARNSLYALKFVDVRTNLFDATGILEEAALDKYTFVRDSWLQRRRSLVYDGSPPREEPLDMDEPKSETDQSK